MQINGITRQLLGPLQLDTATPSSTSFTVAKGSGSSGGNELGAVAGRTFHEILAKYDVTDITPRDFSNLVQELHDAGEIDDAEFRELARMRLEFEQAGMAPDDRFSLVDFFEKKLEERTGEFESLREQAPPEVAATLDEAGFTAEARRQLEWVRKFALIQASGAAGVDVGA